MEKGIIAAPAKVSGNGSKFQSEGALTVEELRYFLLYWDRVVVPTTNLIHLALPEEKDFLSTNVITRPSVPFSGTFNGEKMARAQIEAQTRIANELITHDRNVDWTLHQIGDSIFLPSRDAVQKQMIRVELQNCLPVPIGNVPAHEILEFKERRKDQLQELHKHLEDLYFEVLSSPDPSLKSKRTVSDLKTAIASVDKVASEKWIVTKKFNLSAELNLNAKDIVTGAAAGSAFDFFLDMFTLPIGTIAGALAPVVKVRAKYDVSLKAAQNKCVLGYLASAQKESLISSK
ncbi:hypothetical protein DID95_11870 [Vibrio fluvialis]|nr:hypothetical protein [Vibrio fluvialis]